MSSKLLLSGAVALALAGCAREQMTGRPGLNVVDGSANATSFPAPTRNDMILQQRSYVIGPFDKVAIDVYGVPELTRTVQVDASGTIALPLVGNLEASGLSTRELAALIAGKLRDPQVTVNTDTVSQSVTVDGQVGKPGVYPVFGRMSLMKAIASAEGMSEFARTNYVIVYRRVDNKNYAALYDVRAIRQGAYEDPEVFANDFIYVGEDRGRRTFQTILQSGPLLLTPLVTLLR